MAMSVVISRWKRLSVCTCIIWGILAAGNLTRGRWTCSRLQKYQSSTFGNTCRHSAKYCRLCVIMAISPGVVELAIDCRNDIGALLEILVDIVHKYCRLCVIMAISPGVVELAADCRLWNRLVLAHYHVDTAVFCLHCLFMKILLLLLWKYLLEYWRNTADCSHLQILMLPL